MPGMTRPTGSSPAGAREPQHSRRPDLGSLDRLLGSLDGLVGSLDRLLGSVDRLLGSLDG